MTLNLSRQERNPFQTKIDGHNEQLFVWQNFTNILEKNFLPLKDWLISLFYAHRNEDKDSLMCSSVCESVTPAGFPGVTWPKRVSGLAFISRICSVSIRQFAGNSIWTLIVIYFRDWSVLALKSSINKIIKFYQCKIEGGFSNIVMERNTIFSGWRRLESENQYGCTVCQSNKALQVPKACMRSALH